MNHPWWRHGLERLSRITRPCITSATRRCCTNLSQWQRSFHWKLICHWLKGVLLSDRWNTRSWSFVRHDDVIKWKYFPSSCPFVGGIHRSSVNSPHKGQWHGAFTWCFLWSVNKRPSKPSRCRWFETHRAHCNVNPPVTGHAELWCFFVVSPNIRTAGDQWWHCLCDGTVMLWCSKMICFGYPIDTVKLVGDFLSMNYAGMS